MKRKKQHEGCRYESRLEDNYGMTCGECGQVLEGYGYGGPFGSRLTALPHFAWNGQRAGRNWTDPGSAPSGNGQTEGQIMRLELLQRPISCRASFDPLRRHVWLAACPHAKCGST